MASPDLSGPQTAYATFWTLPLLMQDVQTLIRLLAPFTTARTDCKLTFQRRLVTLWAWLMRFPNTGPRPHNSQVFAMLRTHSYRFVYKVLV
jgi:hypothetical protein